MTRWRLIALAGGLLLVASLFEAGLSRHLAIFDVRPSFLMVLAFSFALCSRPGNAAAMACATGVLQGCLSGASLTAFTVGRTILCFFYGFLERIEVNVNAPLGAGLIALGTVLDGLVTMLISPPSDLGGFVRVTIGSALYNGVLALPVYGLVRRLFRTKDD